MSLANPRKLRSIGLWISCGILLLMFSSCQSAAQASCQDPMCILRTREPGLKEFRILDQRPIDKGHSVLLIQASDREENPFMTLEDTYSSRWSKQQQLTSLFIVDNRTQNVTLLVDIFKANLDANNHKSARCDDTGAVSLEEVSPEAISILRTCTDYLYSAVISQSRKKYFLGPDFQKVNKTLDFENKTYDQVVLFKNQLFLRSNKNGLLQLDPQHPEKYQFKPTSALSNGEQSDQIYLFKDELVLGPQALTATGWKARTIETKSYLDLPSFLSARYLPLETQKHILPSAQQPEVLVIQANGQGDLMKPLVNEALSKYGAKSDGILMLHPQPVFYPLPQPTQEQFKALRLSWFWRRFISPPLPRLHLRIGAFQEQAGKIWLGTTFYDGEGSSGLGTVGYFDLKTRQYHLTYDAEDSKNHAFADWSISALAADPQELWLGLEDIPEGAESSGGLVRYRLADGELQRYYFRPIVSQFQRIGTQLWMTTSEGLYMLEKGKLTYFGISQDEAGKPIMYSRPVELKPI